MKSKDLLICKACGFKIKQCELKSVCPACGVSKKFFELYKDNISGKRRKILDFHFHPIIVHFSVAGSVILFLAIIIGAFVPGEAKKMFFGAAAILSAMLPAAVVGGALSGAIDGVARFKKIRRPVLLKKIYVSAIFLLITVSIAILLFIFGLDIISINIYLIILSLVSAALGSYLGKLGGDISEAYLPGK